MSNLTAKSDANTGVQESYGYDSLNRLRTYTSLGGSVSPPTSTQVVYDARGNILYKSDVGRYWYDSQRPNRLANITLEGYVGAQALTGTRALSYVFDDYGSSARSNGSVPMGNGNLMYTVSHDNASGKHTVRWESYTSFNMPLEIRYGNIGAAQKCPTGVTSDRTLSFAYGPEHQRVKQVVTLSGNAPSQMMGGTTWCLHGDNNSLLGWLEKSRRRRCSRRGSARPTRSPASCPALPVQQRGREGLSSNNNDAPAIPHQPLKAGGE